METVCVKRPAVGGRSADRRRRHAALFLENRRRGGGFENWRSKEETRGGGRKGSLESTFRVGLDLGEHSRGGINDLMGHHHESRAKSGDGNRNSAALSLFNRGKEGCCNGYPSCKGRCRDQTGCHLAGKRLARSSTKGTW